MSKGFLMAIDGKGIFLGSAVALLAATGAQAADMPKAPAREPVYRCDITGFIELPGTDICFKIGGFARFYAGAASDNVVGIGANPGYFWGNIGGNATHTTGDTFLMHAQARLNFDARTTTEYGVLRAFIEMQAEDTNASTGGPFNLRHAFIQFGKWTFGKTDTLFAHGASAPAYTDFITHVGDPYGRSVQVRYTMPLGNGMTLALALEDPAYQPAGDLAVFLGTPPFMMQERDEAPAIVAALGFSGSWGSAQVAAGARRNVYRNAVAPGVFVPGTIADREIGWRVDAGASIDVSSSISLLARAYYSDGFNAHSSLFLGDIISSATGLTIADNVEEWMVMGGVSFAVTPDVAASVSLAYAQSEAGSLFGTGLLGTPSMWGVNVLQAVGNVFWRPVNNFELGVEVAYSDVDYGFFTGPLDGDAFSVAVQATRSF
ncbi:MAG: DcaP family trimeric outer membrane transporter [Flavobacteriaceae bacterium]